MSVPNRFDIVQAVNAAHPVLIKTNTVGTVTEFLWRVVSKLAEADPNFGFLSKSPAENGVDIPGAGRVSIDAIAYQGEHNVVDIISSAGDGPGAGAIGWGETHERRPSNLWVKAVPFPGWDQPPQELPNGPPSEPPAEPPRSDLEARLTALESRMGVAEGDISGAAMDAKDAKTLAERVTAKLDGGLKAKGTIDVPIVVEWLQRRGRAKGDIELTVKE